MLLKSAVVADAVLGASKVSDIDKAFYQGKIFTAQYAVTNLLPQVDGLTQTINNWDRSIIDIGVESF
jgi:2C-methyl-D-erythritol 2,4-cyclodiphosphate synthase